MLPRKVIARLGNAAKDNRLTNSVLRYKSAYYRRAHEAIREARTRPEEAVEADAELLERTLTWARQTAYGKDYGPRLEDWPVLTKSILAASPVRFKRHWRISVPAATGGSTGRPLRLWRSLECIAAEQATIDSLLGDNAPPMLEQRVAVLRADFVKDPADTAPPFGVYRNKGRWLVLSNAHLTRPNLPWFVDALSSFRPEILWVYPTALSSFLRLAEEAGASLSIPTVLSSSEMMSDALFNYAQEALQARVIDRYGQGERVCSAHCDSSREYRFERGYGHVELFPEPVAGDDAGPTTARIVATGYWNSAYPLVRYDTGDRAVLPELRTEGSLERIAKGLDPFHGIVGRADDYVIGRDAEKITGMNHIPRELDSVLQVQIIQDSTSRVRILVLSRNGLSSSDRRQLEQNARELLPPYMELHIQPTDELVSLPNGKTPFIIREPEMRTGGTAGAAT